MDPTPSNAADESDLSRRTPGLRAPSGPILSQLDSAPQRSPWRTTLHLAGFLVGLGLFGWAISVAFSPGNREQLLRLTDAPWWIGAALVGLTAGSIAVNGLIFWVTLSPVRRLSALDCVAVNTLSTMLAYVPFKLSLLLRVLVHRRRDRLAYRTLVAWFAATGGMSVGTLLALGAASVIRPRIDFVWALLAGGLLALWGAAVVVGARLVRKLRRLDTLTLGAAAMGERPSGVAGHISLRVVDVALQAARFYLIARTLGHDLRLDQALLLSVTYFLLGVLSPVGNVGAREGGVMALGALTTAVGLGKDQIAQVALVMTALEAATSLLLCFWASWRVRLLTLLPGRARGGATAPAPPSA